jgi:hypothetical protein
MATKSRENVPKTAKPDIRLGSVGRENAGHQLARWLVSFCDFSWQALAYPPSKKIDMPFSAFFCSAAEYGE